MEVDFSLNFFAFSPLITFPPLLHTHPSTPSTGLRQPCPGGIYVLNNTVFGLRVLHLTKYLVPPKSEDIFLKWQRKERGKFLSSKVDLV